MNSYNILVALICIILWVLSITPLKDFLKDYNKRFIWLWKILTYTPLLNTTVFMAIFTIGLFVIAFEGIGKVFKDIFNKNEI